MLHPMQSFLQAVFQERIGGHSVNHNSGDTYPHTANLLFVSNFPLSLPEKGRVESLRCPQVGVRIPIQCASARGRRPRKPKGYWSNLDNVRQELLDLHHTWPDIAEGTMPTARELRTVGRRDLDNAITKMGGYHTVASMLGLSRSSGRRSAGYWNDFANLSAGIKAFMEENRACIPEGAMPTQKQLRNLRRSDLVAAIEQHGGTAEVAKRLGLVRRRSTKSKHYWKDWSKVEAEVRSFVDKRDRAVEDADDSEKSAAARSRKRLVQMMPSQKELRAAGRADIAEAISDFHGGFREVAKKLGFVSKKKDDFFYDNFYNVAREVYAVVSEIGRESVMPSTAVLKAEGRTDLASAIVKYGGMSEVSQRLGLQYQIRTREAFKEWGLFRRSLMAFMETHGTPEEIPSSRTLSNYGRADLYQAILHHGGSRAVADRMGLKRNYWQDFHNVGKQLLEFVDTHGAEGMMPTEREFLEVGRSALNVAVLKFGHSQVARRLGLSEPPQSTQVALDALLSQSVSLSQAQCCEKCAEDTGFSLG